MTLVYRHLIRTFVPPFFFGLSVTTFVLMIDVLSRYVDLFLEKGIRFGVVAEVLFLSLGHTFALSIPMAVLVGTLMSVGHLAADNEITALKANGVSLYQLARPLLAVGIVVAMTMILYNHFVLPESNHRLTNRLIDIHQLRPALTIREHAFSEITEQYTIYVKHKDDKTGELDDVILFRREGRGDPSPDVVVARKGMLRTVAPGRIQLDLLSGEYHTLPDPEDPSTYQRTAFQRQTFSIDLGADEGLARTRTQRGEREMNLTMLQHARLEELQLMRRAQDESRQILARAFEPEIALLDPTREDLPAAQPASAFAEYRKALTRFDRNARALALKAQVVRAHRLKAGRYAVEYHKKFSIPVACIVFVVLGVPLAVSTGRGGRGVSVGLSLATFLVYYLFLSGGEKLADRGRLSPWLSMWAPNIVLGGLGSYLLYRAVQETRTVDLGRLWRRLPLARRLHWRLRA